MLVQNNCIDAWFEAAFNERATTLDAFSSNCGCESTSLRKDGGFPVADGEIVARILTSPGHYNLETRELISSKLMTAYQAGLSLVRENASADEIKVTVDQLTAGEEETKLVGAAIVKADKIRQLQEDSVRWFCVYDTENRDKKDHAEILATKSGAASKSAQKKAESDRRKALRALFEENFHPAETVDDLIEKIKACRATS
jgi:hypothetical protein